MRLLQVLLGGLFAVFALLAGLFIAAVVAMTGMLIMFIRRAVGRGGVTPLPPRNRSRVSATKTGDVIDVTATEVPETLSKSPDQEVPFSVRAPR
jgi:hypothetical protein